MGTGRKRRVHSIACGPRSVPGGWGQGGDIGDKAALPCGPLRQVRRVRVTPLASGHSQAGRGLRFRGAGKVGEGPKQTQTGHNRAPLGRGPGPGGPRVQPRARVDNRRFNLPGGLCLANPRARTARTREPAGRTRGSRQGRAQASPLGLFRCDCSGWGRRKIPDLRARIARGGGVPRKDPQQAPGPGLGPVPVGPWRFPSNFVGM